MYQLYIEKDYSGLKRERENMDPVEQKMARLVFLCEVFFLPNSGKFELLLDEM